MPRRSGWFLTVESVSGSRVWQPVDSQRQVCAWVERLAPVVPSSSTWYVEWRTE